METNDYKKCKAEKIHLKKCNMYMICSKWEKTCKKTATVL